MNELDPGVQRALDALGATYEVLACNPEWADTEVMSSCRRAAVATLTCIGVLNERPRCLCGIARGWQEPACGAEPLLACTVISLSHRERAGLIVQQSFSTIGVRGCCCKLPLTLTRDLLHL